ncbi:L-threonylcarbamoyladenylate synthase [Vampirovibrio sp.]|uniref:L-threonylcarbamoyladenylate synthase n=1 Tax=Vampirovibrio sp. TaxID=2717857 RepID=UPI00359327BF
MSSSFQPQAPFLTTADLQQAVDILKAGGLVAFPTETVYGLGAHAENADALAKLYAVKGRPTRHPVIVHLGHADQLGDWAVEIPEMAYRLAAAFWPGPLTLILKRSSRVPDAVTGGQDTVGLRVPDHPVALALLQAFGGGIAAPSANRFGRLSPTSAAHVWDDLGQDVDAIVDGGVCQVGVESTIVAFQDGQPIILRPGMITPEQIQAALQSEFRPETGNAASVTRAPGTLASHYAPRTPLKLVSKNALNEALSRLQPDQQIGVLSFSAAIDDHAAAWATMPASPQAYARQLYAKLRELDALKLSCIWVEQVPMEEGWSAVSDRLNRAAFQG